MKLKCPRCKRIMKSFTPTEDERKLFDDDELYAGEAEHHDMCSLCKDQINPPTL